MLKRYSKIILGLVFVLAIIARWWYLPRGAVSFAYDQARDAFLVQQILAGDLKILGPPVSGVPGLYHGVLYYYIIAPAYLFGHGNPVIVAYWLSFLSSLGVFIVYYLARLLTKKVVPGLLAALVFALSFEATQYANLLTNASLAVIFVPILYIGLYLWITKSSKWGPVVTGLGLGLAIQSEIALAYHFAPIALWLWIFRKNITRYDLIKFFALFFLGTSSMIISEVKFGFKGLGGLVYLFSGQDAIGAAKQLGDFLITYLNQLGATLAYSIFPINIVFGGILGLVLIFYSLSEGFRKLRDSAFPWQGLLASYVMAHLVALPFGGWNMRHIMVGAAAGVSAFVGIFLWKYFSQTKIVLILILTVILFANLASILKENVNGQTIFPLQPSLSLSNELSVIDYTYQRAKGGPFSINTLTNPLYVNTLWSYLYNWYGKEKYGYLPYFRGRDQIGSLGNNLDYPPPRLDKHFFIIEPLYGIPAQFVGYAVGEENSRSEIIDKSAFAEIVVEERKIINE